MTASVDDNVVESASLADSDLISVQVPDSPAALFPVSVSQRRSIGLRRGVSVIPLNVEPIIYIVSRIALLTAIMSVVGATCYAGYRVTMGIIDGMSMIVGAVTSLVPLIVFGAVVYALYRWISSWKITKSVPKSSSSSTVVHDATVKSIVSSSSETAIAKPSKLSVRAVDTKSRGSTSAPVPQSLLNDPDTKAWLAKLRDSDTEQMVGAWSSWALPEAFGDDLNLVPDAYCAVGWHPHLRKPENWGGGRKPRGLGDLYDKYGKRLVNGAMSMNDEGKNLRKVADFIEDQIKKNER